MTNYSNYIAYFQSYLKNQSKSAYTVKQYSLDVAQFVKFLQAQEEQVITEEMLQQYRAWLLQHYPSKQSMNRKLASLKSFLSFLQARAIIPMLSDEALRPLTIDKKELPVLSARQLQQALHVWLQVYETAEEADVRWMALRNYTLMQVISALGIKSSEVVRMKWSHIQPQAIRILSKRDYRDLPVTQHVLDMLAFYQDATQKHFALSQATDAIWLGLGNKKGEGITVKTIERLFSYVSKELGFAVTTTNIRYTAIQQDVDNDTQQLEDLYKKYGYARKGILQERATRMEKSE